MVTIIHFLILLELKLLKMDGLKHSILDQRLKLFLLLLLDLSRHINAIIIGVILTPLKRERSWWVVALVLAARPVLTISILVMGLVLPMPMLALGH
jgi:uncharacterized membrane protein YadS